MRNEHRKQYFTRNHIMKLLSAEDVASVNGAETAAPLMDGDVYLDLSHLEQGVRRARGQTTPNGPVLPKKAVQDQTWKNVLTHLAVLESAARASKT
jgi:hypothetical protein